MLIPFSQYIKGDGNFDKINKIKIEALDSRMRYSVAFLDRTVTDLAIQINSERSQKAVSQSEHRFAPQPNPPFANASPLEVLTTS